MVDHTVDGLLCSTEWHHNHIVASYTISITPWNAESNIITGGIPMSTTICAVTLVPTTLSLAVCHRMLLS